MIYAFSSHIIHVRMRIAYTGVKLDVMTEALCAEDGSLPQGLMIQNTYSEMSNGSKNVTIMVRNSMAYPQILRKKIPVARLAVATWVPEPPMQIGMIEVLDEAQDLPAPKLTVKQRQEKLFEKLDLSRLESWPLKLAHSAQSLLAEYHDIFSLELSELSSTHSTKHVIKVTDDTLFKEWFRQIPLLLVEEVHTHLWEILDSDTICPSQSAWCNVVVLVWKKDGGLHFCIDFCLNVCTKKDSYPLLRIQEVLESLVQCWPFFMPRPKVWILANQDGWVIKTVHCIYCWQFGLHQVWLHAFGAVQCTSYVSEVNAKLPQGAESNILPHLPWWHSHFLTDSWRTSSSLVHCFWLI